MWGKPPKRAWRTSRTVALQLMPGKFLRWAAAPNPPHTRRFGGCGSPPTGGSGGREPPVSSGGLGGGSHPGITYFCQFAVPSTSVTLQLSPGTGALYRGWLPQKAGRVSGGVALHLFVGMVVVQVHACIQRLH